mmetsp:Transcript_14142/g.29641  ORF Transcript_14142/g.29641 Transcript_14142/m.29641 type:complete len:223 (+) Transcript_14142:788-1456(+)
MGANSGSAGAVGGREAIGAVNAVGDVDTIRADGAVGGGEATGADSAVDDDDAIPAAEEVQGEGTIGAEAVGADKRSQVANTAGDVDAVGADDADESEDAVCADEAVGGEDTIGADEAADGDDAIGADNAVDVKPTNDSHCSTGSCKIWALSWAMVLESVLLVPRSTSRSSGAVLMPPVMIPPSSPIMEARMTEPGARPPQFDPTRMPLVWTTSDNLVCTKAV